MSFHHISVKIQEQGLKTKSTLPPGLSHMFTIFSSDSQDTRAKSYKMFLAEQENSFFHSNLYIYPLWRSWGEINLGVQSNALDIYKDTASFQGKRKLINLLGWPPQQIRRRDRVCTRDQAGLRTR